MEERLKQLDFFESQTRHGYRPCSRTPGEHEYRRDSLEPDFGKPTGQLCNVLFGHARGDFEAYDQVTCKVTAIVMGTMGFLGHERLLLAIRKDRTGSSPRVNLHGLVSGLQTRIYKYEN